MVRRDEDKGDSETGEETLVGGSEGRRGGGQGAWWLFGYFTCSLAVREGLDVL